MAYLQVTTATLPPLSTKESRRRCAQAQRAYREGRSLKHQKRAGLSKEDLQQVNIFRELGLDYTCLAPKERYPVIARMVEGRRADTLSPSALNFLRDNLDAHATFRDGRQVITFAQSGESKRKGINDMNLVSEVVSASGESRKVVKSVLDNLQAYICDQLKEERRVRIPGLGILALKYSPPREKRKGVSPFSGEPMVFKARPASNKLKFRVCKELKDFCAVLPAVAPKKKKAKKTAK